MNDIQALQCVPVVDATAAISGAILEDGQSGENQVLLAVGESLSLRSMSRPSGANRVLQTPGLITSLVPINKSSVLVSYRKRGIDYFNIYSCEKDFREKMSTPGSLPLGMGAQTREVKASNECDGLVVMQVYEGSLHIFQNLLVGTPHCEVSHINRISPVLTVLSMALVRRGEGSYALIAIFGDNDSDTTLRTFELRISNGKLSVTHVTNLLGGLARVRSEVNPYRLCLNKSQSSILFIGGDSVKYSSLMSMSTSEIFSRESSKECMHCQPLPKASAVAGISDDQFFISSAFGELYIANSKSMTVDLLDDRIPGSVNGTCILSFAPDCLLIGSRHGDSILRFSSGERRTVHQNISPVISVSQSSNFRSLTTVSGAGSSAALNRIKTSGIGVDLIPSNQQVTPENLWIINGEILVISWPNSTVAFSVTQNLILEERQDLKIPPNILGIFSYDTNMFLCVTDRSVVVVPQKGQSRQTWTSPKGSEVVACDYCPTSRALAIATTDGLFRITKSGTHAIERSWDQEISCVCIHESAVAIGVWGGEIQIFQNEKTALRIDRNVNVDPRTLVILEEGEGFVLIAVFGDGMAARVATFTDPTGWKTADVLHRVQLGTLAPRMKKNKDGKSVIVSGDRPCVMTSGLECTELVDRAAGTLLFVREIGGISNEDFLWFLDGENRVQCCRMGAESECHFQRRTIDDSTLLSIFPIGVETMDEIGQVAVGVSRLTSESQTKDYVGFFDIFQFNLLQKIELEERVTGITRLGVHTLLVSLSDGTLVAFQNDAKTGVWSETCRAFANMGPITAINASGSEKYFVCLAARSLSVFQYSSIGNIEHCCSTETNFLGLSLSVYQESEGLRIAVGDIHRSVSLFAFDPMEGLSLKARDLVPACAMAVELLSPDSLMMGDELGNVYFLKMVEPSLARLERLQGCNIGESPISAIKRVSTDAIACWVCSSDGSVSLIGTKLEKESIRAKNIEPVFEPHRLARPSVSDTFRSL